MKVNEEEIKNQYVKDVIKRLLTRILYGTGYLSAIQERIQKADLQPFRIVRYPRIINPSEVPYPLLPNRFLPLEAFRNHLRFYKEHCNIISFEELISRLDNNTAFPKNSIVLTFDFGCVDFYKNTAPLLKTFGFPATLFVPPSFIGTYSHLWQDRFMILVDILRAAKVPFPQLPELDDAFYNIVSANEKVIEPSYENALLLINYLQAQPVTKRFANILVFFKYVEDEVNIPSIQYFMNWEQLKEVSKNNISISSFGASYKNFNELSDEEITAELALASQFFKEADIKTILVLASADESMLVPEKRKFLKEIGVDNICTNSYAKDVLNPEEYSRVFRRVRIDSDITDASFLMTLLWDLKLFGIRLS